MRKGILGSLAVALAAATANAGNIVVTLSTAAAGPFAANTNVTVRVSLSSTDDLADLTGIQIDRRNSSPVGNAIGPGTVAPAPGLGSNPVPLFGSPAGCFTDPDTLDTFCGNTFNSPDALVWVWVNGTIPHTTIFGIPPSTPTMVARFNVRTSSTPGGSVMVDVIGPCDSSVDVGAKFDTNAGQSYENCDANGNVANDITGMPLTLTTVPEPGSVGLLVLGAIAALRRRAM